jgi:hypothetical protein
MNANQSDDPNLGPCVGEPSTKAELNRSASNLEIYELERFAYTDAANAAESNRKPASSGSFTRLKALLRNLIS